MTQILSYAVVKPNNVGVLFFADFAKNLFFCAKHNTSNAYIANNYF